MPNLTYTLSSVNVSKLTNYAPRISRKKSNKNKGIYTDVLNVMFNNTDNEFTPYSANSIFESQYPTSNDFTIDYGNTRIYTGVLRHVPKTARNPVTLQFTDTLGKFSAADFSYNTFDRGDGSTTFDTSEYNSDGTYYWETPAYAAYHVLRLAGLTDSEINTSSLSDADTNYTSSTKIAIIKETSDSVTPLEILNYISAKFFLYIYKDSSGLICFEHGTDFTSTYISVSRNNINGIRFIEPLDYYNDYEIQTDDFTWRTASDNSSYGSSYRTAAETNRKLIIEAHGICIIYDDTTADYFGEYAIDNFYKKRQGVAITTYIDDDRFNFVTGCKITYDAMGWNEKNFEIFEIIDDYNATKKTVKAYEIL